VLFGVPLATEEPASALLVRPFWILVSIANFVVLLYILRRVLWKPVLAMLEERARRIREGLDLAEASKRDREEMKAEVERLLTEARREAAAIAERTTAAAEAAALEIRTQGKAEADRIRERARADAEQLHRQSLAELRGEVASLAVLAASKVLGREVDERAHRELIERSLSEAGGELKAN
jgi:F-type H+-transporting ATPase subunit b